MSARTRRQKASPVVHGVKSEGDSGTVLTSSERTTPAREEPEENVFLFVPNLIGKMNTTEEDLKIFSLPFCIVDTRSFRLLSNRSSYRVALLYAPPSAHLFSAL